MQIHGISARHGCFKAMFLGFAGVRGYKWYHPLSQTDATRFADDFTKVTAHVGQLKCTFWDPFRASLYVHAAGYRWDPAVQDGQELSFVTVSPKKVRCRAPLLRARCGLRQLGLQLGPKVVTTYL